MHKKQLIRLIKKNKATLKDYIDYKKDYWEYDEDDKDIRNIIKRKR